MSETGIACGVYSIAMVREGCTVKKSNRGWLLVVALWMIAGQVLAIPSAIVLRVLDESSRTVEAPIAVVETFEKPSLIKTSSLVPLKGGLTSRLLEVSQPLTDFVFFSGSTSDGVLAYSSALSDFAQTGGKLGFARLDFNRGKIFDVYMSPDQRRVDPLNFNYVSLEKIAPTAEPSSLAVSVPSGGALYPGYASLSYYNQTIIFDIGKALNGNGQVAIVGRIPGQYTGSAFLDNERLALVGPKGITLVSASTSAVIGSAESSGLSKVASHNGATIFWGNSRLALLEANQLKYFDIPNETIDSCSVVLKNIPVCATSGNGKTLWYYSAGQLAIFWKNPALSGDPWKIGIGEGLILPFLTSNPDKNRLTMYAYDGSEIGSQKNSTARPFLGAHLVSLVGLVAKLRNESLPVIEQTTYTAKPCNRPYGSTSQVGNWVLVTGCDEITLVDLREGRVILRGPTAEVVPSLIFQATGQRVAWNGGKPDKAEYVGLGQSVDGKPLLVVKQTSLQFSGHLVNFPFCAVAFALDGDKFTTVARINPHSGSSCDLRGGHPRVLVSETEVVIFTSGDANNTGSVLSIYERNSGKRLVSFNYKYGDKTAFTVEGKMWRTDSAPTVITDVVPSKDGYRLFGYFNGVVGSYELSLLDGSLSKFTRTAPFSGQIGFGAIGNGWQYYGLPTVEGLVTPGYVSPEGDVTYVTDTGIIRIKLSSEVIKRWAGQ